MHTLKRPEPARPDLRRRAGPRRRDRASRYRRRRLAEQPLAAGDQAHHRAGARRLGGRLELEQSGHPTAEGRVHRRCAAQPLRGVANDSAYLASYLATVPGPIVLVGHSYGGFITTNAATGNKNVKALVYVDAYIPAQGDTINGLTAQFPGSRISPAALNFVPSAGGVVDAYINRHSSATFSPTTSRPPRTPNSPPPSARSPGPRSATCPARRLGPASRAGPSSGRRTTRSRRPRRNSWPNAPTRRDHDGQRLAPVADFPARQGHQHHRGRRPPPS